MKLYPLVEVSEATETGMKNLAGVPSANIPELLEALKTFEFNLRENPNNLRIASKAAHSFMFGFLHLYKTKQIDIIEKN